MFILSQHHSVASHFLAELRDINTQKDRMQFRENLYRLGEIFAYEISKNLTYKNYLTPTPLGNAETHLMTETPVLATILRAGLPLYDGMLHFFDKAESAFIGAYRGGYQSDNSFEIELHYVTAPDLTDKILILTDPMLATGKSLFRAYKALLKHGTPKQLHIVAAIASEAGLAFLQKNLPDAQIWLGDLDKELNVKSYIVPGLGDAGDLAFGMKN